MANKESSIDLITSTSLEPSLPAENLQKHEKTCNNSTKDNSIKAATLMQEGMNYFHNSAENPLVIVDDEDEYEHPPVILRPYDPAENEPAWDLPVLQIKENANSVDNISANTSTSSE